MVRPEIHEKDRLCFGPVGMDSFTPKYVVENGEVRDFEKTGVLYVAMAEKTTFERPKVVYEFSHILWGIYVYKSGLRFSFR